MSTFRTIVIVAVAVVVLTVFGVYAGSRGTKEQPTPESVSEQMNGTDEVAQTVPSFAYTVADRSGTFFEVHEMRSDGTDDRLLHRFSLNSANDAPAATTAFNSDIVVNLGGGGRFVVPSTGDPVRTDVNFGDEALRSPSGNSIAFTRFKTESEEEQELVIRNVDGTEQMIDAGNFFDVEEGLLHPLHWSSDERTLYLDRVIPTGGYRIGLFALDGTTMELERIAKIDELGIARYVFDRAGNIYGFKLSETVGATGGDAPQEIVRLSLTDGSVTTFPLDRSGLADLLAVDAAGRYLAYANAAEFARDLWVYDLATGEERSVTENAVVHEVLGFSNGTLVFREESTTAPTTTDIVSYDIATGTRTVLVEGGSDAVVSLIDWYPLP